MNRKALLVATCSAALGLAAAVGSIAIAADPPAKPAAAAAPDLKLPPGWTAEDMKACMLASTPGKQHEFLAKAAGAWTAKSTMWMAPEAEPAKSDATSTVTVIMDGRFIKTEFAGEMPGMGPYTGLGTTGFDNVTGKFIGTWIDNQGTGMMVGTGELSADGKVLTWAFNFNCPLNKKPSVMRQIETISGPNTRTLEMWGPEPKSGKEYKIMSIEFTKKQ